MIAPFDITSLLGTTGANWIVLGFGAGFGFILERAGFGNCRKLAAQFYLQDQTVLKVMFTAIVLAMLLIFLYTGFGFLDFDQVWVNPTYLWSGILGGLLLGMGFLIGGY